MIKFTVTSRIIFVALTLWLVFTLVILSGCKDKDQPEDTQQAAEPQKIEHISASDKVVLKDQPEDTQQAAELQIAEYISEYISAYDKVVLKDQPEDTQQAAELQIAEYTYAYTSASDTVVLWVKLHSVERKPLEKVTGIAASYDVKGLSLMGAVKPTIKSAIKRLLPLRGLGPGFVRLRSEAYVPGGSELLVTLEVPIGFQGRAEPSAAELSSLSREIEADIRARIENEVARERGTLIWLDSVGIAPYVYRIGPQEGVLPPRSPFRVAERTTTIVAIGRAAAKQRDQSTYTPGTYDPRLLMPLSVGSSWTYKWTSPKVQGEKPVKFPESFFNSARYYSYNQKTVTAKCYHYDAQCHEETYTIVRRDGDHYFFEVTANPEVSPDQIRDGRYEDSLEHAWTWWGERGKLGLTESIKRPWSIHRGYLAEGTSVKEGDYPADDRIAIQMEYANGAWNKTHVEYVFTNKHAFEYRIMGDTEVTVPAGKFFGCAESIEKVLADDKDNSVSLWEIHTFRCPRVGMVREYLKLPDGSIAYELQLVEYALVSYKADAGDGK